MSLFVIQPKRTKEYWSKVFAAAKHGHILWDGNDKDPTAPELAYVTAQQFIQHAKFLGFFKDKSRILDIGCGNGRFCIFFSEMNVTYDGIDPMLPCIDFCKQAFGGYPQLHFHFANIYNQDSNPKGIIQSIDYLFPFPDQSFDDVIAYSVFTHLERPEVAKHYMSEIKRVLRRNGKLFITCYRSPPNPKADPYVGRTVYLESDIMTMLNGFSFDYTYGGHTDQFYDQWGLFCTKL